VTYVPAAPFRGRIAPGACCALPDSFLLPFRPAQDPPLREFVWEGFLLLSGAANYSSQDISMGVPIFWIIFGTAEWGQSCCWLISLAVFCCFDTVPFLLGGHDEIGSFL